jgi:hypothetical protein
MQKGLHKTIKRQYDFIGVFFLGGVDVHTAGSATYSGYCYLSQDVVLSSVLFSFIAVSTRAGPVRMV